MIIYGVYSNHQLTQNVKYLILRMNNIMTDIKMNKTAKTLDTFVKIFQIIAIIGIVMSLVGAAVMGVCLLLDVPTEQLMDVNSTITLDNMTLTLSEDFSIALEKTFAVGMGTMCVMAVYMAILHYFMKVLRDIFAPMKEGKPFHDSVSLNLKKLGYGGIAMFVMEAVASLVGGFLTMTVYPIQEMLGSAVTHIDYSVEVNMAYLFLAAICFLLSYIFKYGTQLQQLSDETL